MNMSKKPKRCEFCGKPTVVSETGICLCDDCESIMPLVEAKYGNFED